MLPALLAEAFCSAIRILDLPALWHCGKKTSAIHLRMVRVVSWCKGSTRDFDSLCLGSNPGETIFLYSLDNKYIVLIIISRLEGR